jgi:hypothetical protein
MEHGTGKASIFVTDHPLIRKEIHIPSLPSMKPSPLLAIPFSLGLTLLLAGCAPETSPPNVSSSGTISSIGHDDQNLVKTYIGEHIGSLSPKPPVLGGAFYVTNVEFLGDNRARVSYEDGHIALTGIATYAVQNGIVSITSFEVEENGGAQSSSRAGA